MQFNTINYQRAAATLLAATASSFLPILTPIRGFARASGFYYDFLCKQEVDETVLTLLTEEMRRHIQQKAALELFTFVPQNGANFLQKSQPVQAALLAEMDETTVELVKCATFYDIVQQAIIDSCEGLREFLLYELEKKEAFYEGLGTVLVVRIHGAVFEDRKSVKNFAKQAALSQKNDPVVKAQSQDLVVLFPQFLAQPIWLPKGLAFYDKVVDRWSQLASRHEITHVSASEQAALFFLNEQYKKKKGEPVRVGQWFCREQNLLPQECEGLFQTVCSKSDTIYRHICDSAFEKEFISSLQFIHELLSMIGLEFWHVLLLSKARNKKEIQEKMIACLERGGYPITFEKSDMPNVSPRLELRAKDLRAREWQLSQIEASMGVVPNSWLLSQVTVFSLERVLALMLERDMSI